MPHVQEPGMKVPEHPMCDPQKIRIIHVGMGAAGMLCAFKAKRMLSNYELVCYEKNSEVGGLSYREVQMPLPGADIEQELGMKIDIPAALVIFQVRLQF